MALDWILPLKVAIRVARFGFLRVTMDTITILHVMLPSLIAAGSIITAA